MSDDGVSPSASAEVRARRSVATAGADPGLAGTAAVLQRICRAAVGTLALRGCVIHLVGSEGATGLAASSDEWSAQVADITFGSGEGPSVDTLAGRRPVLLGDLVVDGGRWPGFAQAAGEMGVGAVFSFPLLVGALSLGVLEVYSSHARTLWDDEAALIGAFTDLTMRTLLGEQVVHEDGTWDETRTWEPLVDPRAEIHQAQGMVMVDLGVDLAEALARMRAHAFVEGTPLIDLAHAIIGGLVLPPAAPEPSP